MTAPAKELTKRASLLQTARPAPTPAVTLRAFLTAFGSLGWDTDLLMRVAGVTRSLLEDPDASVPCEALSAVICEALRTRRLKNPGIKAAAQISIGAFPLLDYLIVTSDTLGQAVTQLSRYLRIMGAPFSLEIYDRENPVRLVYTAIPDPFTAEFEVALPIFHLRNETDSRLSVAYASLTHQPDDVTEVEQTLGCPVRAQASWNGIALPAEALHLPMRRRDPVLHQLLRHDAEKIRATLPSSRDVVAQVRHVLTSLLAHGNAEIQVTARALASSVRSLQRRLAAAGTSYQAVLDSTRQEAATSYLAGHVFSIAEIGYLLGYSEPAAFHRAFKRWTGLTPHEFRTAQYANVGASVPAPR
jgi:AraC-like DNA-binding protein